MWSWRQLVKDPTFKISCILKRLLTVGRINLRGIVESLSKRSGREIMEALFKMERWYGKAERVQNTQVVFSKKKPKDLTIWDNKAQRGIQDYSQLLSWVRGRQKRFNMKDIKFSFGCAAIEDSMVTGYVSLQVVVKSLGWK